MIIGISGKMQSGKNTVASIIQYLTNPFYIDMKTEFNVNEDYSAGSVWKQKSFAGKVKQIASILTGIPVENLEKNEVKNMILDKEWWYFDSKLDGVGRIPYRDSLDTSIKLVKPTVRQLLQEIGTEAMRNVIHPDIWANTLFINYRATGDNLLEGEVRKVREEDLIYPSWCITDMRFPNELQAVKDRGGISIRVNKYDGYAYNSDLPSTSSPLEHLERGKYLHASETVLDNAKFDFIIANTKDIPHLISEVKKVLLELKLI